MDFSGKNVVITGGTIGIGLEIIKELLKNNVKNLAILDLNDKNNVVDELSKKYPEQNVYLFNTDVTNVEHLQQSFAKTIDKFEFIDIVIGNAGILDEKFYEKTIQVNLLGMMHTTYTALELMNKNKGGRGGLIVNIASVAGLDKSSIAPAYAASKHGVIGFTRSFGDDFHFNNYGVKFIAICPGLTDTAILHNFEDKLINKEAMEIYNVIKSTFTLQTPQILASRLMEIIKFDKNGSIWIIDGGQFSEITLTKYWDKN